MMAAITRMALLAGLVIAGSRAAANSPAVVVLPMNTEILLETVVPLSSKTSVKGDLVALRTASELRIDGRLVIPKGAEATGQVIDARGTGALGMSGKLALRPLYLKRGDVIVRLAGQSSDKGKVSAGAVLGMAVLSPGFSGRSAIIPGGTILHAYVERSIDIVFADSAF